MAVVDIPNKTVTLKIVYYGCAMGGKTTNLVMLHQLTDPDNTHGMVSIATKDDRTLFFDLLPMELGQIGGLLVKAKLYTVPGQLHYELTRRQVLAGADGVVLVCDSNPSEEKSNSWALENLRYNLKQGGFDPDEIPLALQWNKRDLPKARSVAEMNADLNKRGVPAIEAVAVQGSGVVDTFATILKETIHAVYQKTGRTTVSKGAIDAVVDKALEQAAKNQPQIDGPTGNTGEQFDHRFDMDAYKDETADREGRAREIVDESSLLAESVKTNMMLAERLDQFNRVQNTNERRKSMMKALGALAPRLTDATQTALPDETLGLLLKGANRKLGSMLFFKGQEEVMEERRVVPEGEKDLLNGVVAEGLGSLAWRLSKERDLRVVEDLANDIFFGVVPAEAQEVASALIAQLSCDGAAFGSLILYSRISEQPFDEAEVEYWSTASRLIGLSLHWRALRRKVMATR